MSILLLFIYKFIYKWLIFYFIKIKVRLHQWNFDFCEHLFCPKILSNFGKNLISVNTSVPIFFSFLVILAKEMLISVNTFVPHFFFFFFFFGNLIYDRRNIISVKRCPFYYYLYIDLYINDQFSFHDYQGATPSVKFWFLWTPLCQNFGISLQKFHFCEYFCASFYFFFSNFGKRNFDFCEHFCATFFIV